MVCAGNELSGYLECWLVSLLLCDYRDGSDANNPTQGTPFDIINVWVTRWDAEKKQMVEIRTYIDAMKVTQLIHESEGWWNGSRHLHHYEWMPGPYGMPNLTELYALMPEEDRPKGRGPGEGLTGQVVGYLLPEQEEAAREGYVHA